MSKEAREKRRSESKRVFFPSKKGKDTAIKPPKKTELDECTELASGVIFVQCKDLRCKRALSPESTTMCKKHFAQSERDAFRRQKEQLMTTKLSETSDMVFAEVLKADQKKYAKSESYQPAWFKAHVQAKTVIDENKELWKQNKNATKASIVKSKLTVEAKDLAEGKPMSLTDLEHVIKAGELGTVTKLIGKSSTKKKKSAPKKKKPGSWKKKKGGS